MASSTSVNQDALAARRASISFIHDDHALTRRYTQQLHSIIMHARIRLGDEYLTIPTLVSRLYATHSGFDRKAYVLLMTYFCNELVTKDTFLISPEEPPGVDDIGEIAKSIHAIDTSYLITFTQKTFTDANICYRCVCYMAMLYLRTALEHCYTCMNVSAGRHTPMHTYTAAEWAASALFNHDTPFKKKGSIHCYIMHRVYDAMMQERNFYAKVTELYNAVCKRLYLHVNARPQSIPEICVDMEHVPHSNISALEYILRYMNYPDDKRHCVYWVAAYLVICQYALVQGVDIKERMPSLISSRRKKNRVPFFFTHIEHSTLLFYSSND